ncbi:hypothetical protein [Bacillus sp. V5-8f]|uniref:hypothetical protein n=1 Tax=Bacillus sp. V5-8f TaxID=2053044 RepID=UPI000C75716D|nr:hypothetical protein [Bacillus sp. V5-8f]PLT34064.1 hypothetical protein CUU64_10690 [Bacillus sp. V5-8f]
MKLKRENFDFSEPSSNDIHDEALIHEFMENIGENVLILTPSYPFVFIGKIVEIVDDHAVVDVETTTIVELEKRKWHIHIHQIEAFYIERKGLPAIPNLKDNF